MTESRKCSRCGTELSADAPGGHCLACLLQLGLQSGETSAEEVAAGILPAGEGGVLPSGPSMAEKPGDRIGHYKLLQQIGEGGCGVVYMAEQEEPVRRRVALKIIKLGMDTRQVIARFEAERQALAMMDHPNIAKVFDAGSTECPLTPSSVAAGVPPASEPGVPPGGEGFGRSKQLGSSDAVPGGRMPPSTAGETPATTLSAGRPYFVMELVRGIKITTYCDQQKLSTRQRLDLFVQVCQAVQHAHQKGIIHRDIKPSNILVTEQDGAPVPKIIDFGIAKATTDQRLTDKTLFTAFEQFIGTPAYMSPEQAGLGGLDIDTRSDIYSLGVLLYELLTGRPPFDAKELHKAGLDEMRRTIREQEPAKPSTRLTLELVAASRKSAGDFTEGDTGALTRRRYNKELISLLRGDLDWIVMKALEKDRRRRYETANGLARDLRRYLDNEPVVARPPSNLYRFQKMVRRNRLLFAAAGAVAAALLVGLGLSTLMFIRERDATRRAVVGEKQAEREAANSEREAGRARHAEADAKEKLWGSYLAQAQARRWSGRVGRRIEALEALKKAAAIRPSLELRNEAIACLALSDLAVLKEWDSAGSPFAATFDASYERYVRGETNGTISVRRVEDDQEVASFPAFGPPFAGMSFSRDGAFLMQFGGLPHSRLQVWKLKESQSVLVVTNEATRAAMFSSDSRLLAVATFTQPNYPLHIYDLGSGELRKSFDLGSLLWGGQFHPTQTNLLATSDAESVVRVWDWTSGIVVQTLKHPSGVRAIFWHPEGHWLATACEDYRIHLWDVANGQEIAALQGHTGVVVDVGFNRDGSVLYSRTWDESLRLWDTASRKELLSRQVPGFTYGFGATQHRIGYTAGPERLGILEVVFAAGYRVLRAREDKVDRIHHCTFSRDGHILASSHEEHIRFWDTATGREIACLPGNFADAAFDTDNEHFFTRTQAGVREWQADFSSAKNIVTFQPTRQFAIKPGTILLNRDATLLGGAAEGGEFFELLDLPSGELKARIRVPDIFFAALSPDGKLAASWPRGDAGHIEIIELASTQTVARLPIRNGARAAFSPNGRWLATGDNTEYRLWDRDTWKPLYTVPRQFTDTWSQLAFSADNSMLAVAHSLDVVRLLEAATGRGLATLEAPEPQDIIWISFSSDGTQLAVASAHGPIHLWNLGVIRQQLDEMKLDWDLPPLPSPRGNKRAQPITVSFLGVTNNPGTDRAAGPPAVAPRDARCRPNLIDLSAAYNATLTNCWFNPAWPGNDLSALPQGIQTLQGIEFDIRGVVQLHGTTANLVFKYAPAVTAIQVNQPCRALHFLHAVGWDIAKGTEVGQYLVHYHDGVERSVPLFFGENISWWCRRPRDNGAYSEGTSLAWRGQNPSSGGAGYDVVLYKFRWPNPRPEVEIRSIDFKSAMTEAAPFLIAITAEGN